MAGQRPRRFGERIDFKSLACAPINEQGVVYLFGVLHEAFDFRVESVQTGFPDCIARRPIGKGRWEEVRIEFEFKSSSFRAHGHDPFGADLIICWLHDWRGCPEHLEVIELSKLLGDVVGIALSVREPKKLTEYQKFCQKERLEGLSFPEIAAEWQEQKVRSSDGNPRGKAAERSGKRPLTGWQKFCGEKRQEGLSFPEIAKLWRER